MSCSNCHTVAPSGLGCALNPQAQTVDGATLHAINLHAEEIAAHRYSAQQLRRAATSEDLIATDLQSNLKSYCARVISDDAGPLPSRV